MKRETSLTPSPAALVAGLAAAFALALPLSGEEQAGTHVMLQADEIEWQPGPGSLEQGAEYAVLYGDPAAEAPFAMRLKLPAGFRIAPHTHPRPEIVTIISGTFLLGTGEEPNRETATSLEPGAFFAFDPGMVHYVFTDDETVVQLNSTGPWAIEYVNPEDDPRS